MMLSKYIFSLAVLMGTPAVARPSACDVFDNADIIANDGHYLGRISSDVAANSVLNDIGRYGSNISSESIWNNIGQYGSDIASASPWNSITSTPPFIMKDKKVIARLTVNDIVTGAISPNILFPVCYGMKPRK